MSFVVALFQDNTCKAYRSKDEVPAEAAMVLESPEELAKTAPKESLDKIRGSLLGEPTTVTSKSQTADEAARKLWYVLGLQAPDPLNFYSVGRQKDKLGNDKVAENGDFELIQLMFKPGVDYMADFFYKKLPKQAKQIVDILLEDGRGIWDADTMNQILVSRAGEFNTRQKIEKVISFYRSELVAKRILKRVTYLEFSGASREVPELQ